MFGVLNGADSKKLTMCSFAFLPNFVTPDLSPLKAFKISAFVL